MKYFFLYRIQEEREERHKYKGTIKSVLETDLDLLVKPGETGSFDNGDPTTTNLYLGNLNPKVCDRYFIFINIIKRFTLFRLQNNN